MLDKTSRLKKLAEQDPETCVVTQTIIKNNAQATINKKIDRVFTGIKKQDDIPVFIGIDPAGGIDTHATHNALVQKWIIERG